MSDDMTELQLFAYNLEKHRKARKMSLKKLSELSGVSYIYLTRTAKGEENISLNNMAKIAKALGVPLYILLLPKDC